MAYTTTGPVSTVPKPLPTSTAINNSPQDRKHRGKKGLPTSGRKPPEPPRVLPLKSGALILEGLDEK